MRQIPALAAIVAGLACGSAAFAQGRVEMEIANAGGAVAALEAQNWARLLKQCQVDHLTIREARADDKPTITSDGTDDKPVYKVLAVLTEKNQLLVPGGKFTQHDAVGLSRWLTRLREQGPPGSAKPKLPFGLTEKQLEQVKEDLARPVTFATKGLDRAEVLAKIGGKLSFPLAPPRDAAAPLTEAGSVAEELHGFASGTALACVLRPAGLGLTPVAAKGNLQYEIRSLRGETWPVGFYAEEKELKLLPGLLEFITAEIKPGTSMNKALAAVAGRLEVPVLMDHNALALADVDPETVTVSAKSGRYTISSLLQRILAPSRLTSQVRSDEAGKPFLWVTAPR